MKKDLTTKFKIPQIPLQRSCLLAPRVKYGQALVRSPGVIDGQARAHVRIDHVGIPFVTSLPPRDCQVKWSLLDHLASFWDFWKECLQKKYHPNYKCSNILNIANREPPRKLYFIASHFKKSNLLNTMVGDGTKAFVPHWEPKSSHNITNLNGFQILEANQSFSG